MKIQHRQVHEDEEAEADDADEDEVDFCRSDDCFHSCFCCFSHGSWYWLVSSDVRTALEKLLKDFTDISELFEVEQQVADTEKGRHITYLHDDIKSFKEDGVDFLPIDIMFQCQPVYSCL